MARSSSLTQPMLSGSLHPSAHTIPLLDRGSQLGEAALAHSVQQKVIHVRAVLEDSIEKVPINSPSSYHQFAEIIAINDCKFAEQVLERGEKIDSLVQKSEGLGHQVCRRCHGEYP